MEPDDFLNHDRGATPTILAGEDLDPLSVDELAARIVVLEREIRRCRDRIDRARDHRASADSLFRS